MIAKAPSQIKNTFNIARLMPVTQSNGCCGRLKYSNVTGSVTGLHANSNNFPLRDHLESNLIHKDTDELSPERSSETKFPRSSVT
jgi:hypothetical protein